MAETPELTDRKVRISIFGPTDHTYSIDRYARELARNFPSSVEARVIHYTSSGGLLRKQLDRFRGYPRYAETQKGDFNVIITEAYGYLLNKLPGKNTICICHDMHGLTYTGPRTVQYCFYYLRYRWALRFLKQAKFIVAVSQNTKDELLRFCPWLPAEKIVPVHNGLEDRWKQSIPVDQRMDALRKLGLQRRRYVLHVGNDLWYKNLPGVIRAFSWLADPELLLVCVSEFTAETQSLVRELNLADRVLRLSGLSDDELATLYQSAELFVFPSFTEGFGWPPLEAMASGCPTICSNIGSLREICGDASVFVEPHDIEGIANAMGRVLREPDLRSSLIAKGHLQAERFSWRATASKFLELFQRS